MSYHNISIGKLSPTQINKILNSYPVRIKGGSVHTIGVSKEQLKKFAKAHDNGKSYTISLDPYQIQNLQHLRGRGTGHNLAKILGDVAGKAAQDGGTRLTSAIDGSDPSDASYDTTGGSVNRISKAQRWTGFVQKDLGLQKVQDALMNKAASNITYGFGLKKRVVKRKPRKISGRALFNA